MCQLPEIHLYHAPGTRSERVKLLLDRLGFPYEQTLVDQSTEEHKSEEYLRINPFGVLPGMTVDGVPVVESAAQMLVVADLDLNAMESVRRTWPFFRDRRIDQYGALLHRWHETGK